MTGPHECPIDGCQHLVPSHKLMCAAHWALVPAKLGKRVYTAWNSGHGKGTVEHEEACEEAIAAVHAALVARRE
jgi:hypothetical protein